MQPDLFNKTPVLITVANGKGARPVKPVHYSHDQLILSCTASIAWFLFCPGVLIYFLCFIVLSQTDIGGVDGGESLYLLSVLVFSCVFSICPRAFNCGFNGQLSGFMIQSFLTGLAAAGTLTSGLRLVTKEALERSENGVRIGASMNFSLLFCQTPF
ncbi:hypothetical protein V6N13_018312 [Hibiscus sabdariffa]